MLVYLDESGSQALNDPGHPVFGFGGCVAPLATIERDVREPWRAMKAALGLKRDEAFHATDRKWHRSGRDQILEDFFRDQRFGRVAAMAHRQTHFAPGSPNPFTIVAKALLLRVVNVVLAYDVTPPLIQFVFESSASGDPLAAQALAGVTHLPAPLATVAVDFKRMQKSAGDEAVEIADFIAWAAGRQAREHHNCGPDGPWNNAFSAIFREADDCADYIDVVSTEVVATDSGWRFRRAD